MEIGVQIAIFRDKLATISMFYQKPIFLMKLSRFFSKSNTPIKIFSLLMENYLFLKKNKVQT